jgi:uncharacterized membrane protein YccC
MLRTKFTSRALHDARAATAVARARPAYAGGFRAAIATVTPLIADHLLGLGGGSWMSLAGLNGALADRGGPYRTRAVVMTGLALASAAAALIASAVAGSVPLAVAATFALAFGCGLVRVWPDIGAGFGVTTLVTFTICLAVPATTLGAALMRPVYIIVGGLWAMLLSVIVWPLTPYRPVRLGVGACYRAVADFLDALLARLAKGPARDAWEFKEQIVAVRTTLESARTALAVSRRGRAAETARGERLLMLHELADQLYAHLIALMEVVGALPTVSLAIVATLQDIAGTARDIAAHVESERDLPRVPVHWSGQALRDHPDATFEVHYEQIAALIDRMADYATAASATVATLNSGASVPDADIGNAASVDVGDVRAPLVQLFSLRVLLSPDSVVLQHALRIAIVTSVAVLVTGLFHLDHGYWVTLTAVVILQPYTGATTQKALQRVLGTILGGIVAAGLSALFHGFGAVLILVALFTACCVALLPLNYGAYAVFGTPAFVLLAEASTGDWHLAGVRILNTLIGGALALAGSRLLWPSAERNRLPEFAAAALRASRDFLRLAVDMVTSGGEISPGVLRDTRRAVGLAASNAEESFQRMIGEHTGPAAELEPMMAFLVYTRRFGASIAALALAARTTGPAESAIVSPFARVADEILEDLADALVERRPPAPFPAIGSVALPDASSPAAVRLRVNRLARQLRMLHDSVERWVAPGQQRAAPNPTPAAGVSVL